MPNYRQSHNVLESIYNYINNNVQDDWSNVTVVQAFQDAYKANLPVICIDLPDAEHISREIGSTNVIDNLVLDIDIFETSNTRALDMRDYLIDKLKVGCPYYEYSQQSGGGGSLVGTLAGRISVFEWVDDTKVELGETYHQNDKFRRLIEVVLRVSLT